jgi:hypothetical protein
MTFTEFVIQNHPDPNDVLVDCRIDELNKLAQAYADAQSLEFARFVDDAGFVPESDNIWINVGDDVLRLTDAELLQKYREQNK